MTYNREAILMPIGCKLKKGTTNEREPFTKIPNRLIRSKLLTVYDKIVFCCIASCNPSYPSYEKIIEWTGLSRGRVWKSIKRLKEMNIIQGIKTGRSMEYRTHWTSSSGELVVNKPVHEVNSTSSPREPIQFTIRTLTSS